MCLFSQKEHCIMVRQSPLLLPAPRELSLASGSFTLKNNALIVIASPELFFEACTAQDASSKYAAVRSEIVAGHGYSDTVLSLATDSTLSHPEGYRLTIDESGIAIHGTDSAGIFYGVCTLRQLLQQYGNTLPCLAIHDWPDFPARGVMLDISRDRVPTMQTLLDLVDRLASWKINQLQLYMEHTFAYRHHPEVWEQASPITGEEILELDDFCHQRHIDLIPNQNSLGHMERWLKHDRYHHLAECPDGFEPPWGGHMPPTTLNPLDPGSIELIAGLYDELLPHFTSPRFNVGGDEPWELGKDKSKAEFETKGGRVYLEYLLKLHKEVTARGRQMQFWADIIVHYPELIPEVPKDITAMSWIYEGGEDAEKEWNHQLKLVSSADLPFYVCPGTSSWNSLAGRSDNAIDNCRSAARLGLQYGAVGYLITDWGDNGHWQPLPVSYTGFAYGAGVSWCYKANQNLDMPAVLNTFAFEDKAGVMGKIAFDLGNVYHIVGTEHINGQILAYALQIPRDEMDSKMLLYQARGQQAPDLRPETLRQTINRIDEIMNPLENSAMRCSDADLIMGEYRQVADLLRHSARRFLLLKGDSTDTPKELMAELQDLIARQRANWLARSRSGGLKDSIRGFDTLINDYQRML
jgi:hexosaminidase